MALSYSTTLAEIDRAEGSILETISAHHGESVAPRDVIRAAIEHGIKESIARSAIWFLLDRNVIRLTDDRKLVASPQK